MILLDSVSRQFHRKDGSSVLAINGLSLYIPKGITVGVIGVSGSGKTTLFKLLCGLLMPDSGSVKVNHLAPVKHRKQLSEDISVLFADHSMLYPEKSIMDNLDLIKTYSGKKEGQAECRKLMEELDLIRCQNELVKNLSLGYRRRAELAAVFCKPAELFLLDEPCIGLDLAAKQCFEKIVKEYQKQGKTILISSHSMGEIEYLSQRVLLLHEGKAFFYGTCDNLYRTLTPIRQMKLSFLEHIPDMQDLPYLNYTLDKEKLHLVYNSNHITAAEILQTLLETSELREISMEIPDLETVLKETVEGGKKDGSFHRGGRLK